MAKAFSALRPILSKPFSPEVHHSLMHQATNVELATDGALMVVLALPDRARAAFEHVRAGGAPALARALARTQELTKDKFHRLTDTCRSQVLWIVNELILHSPSMHAELASVLTGVLRFLGSESFAQCAPPSASTWLADGSASPLVSGLLQRALGLFTLQTKWILTQRSLCAVLFHRLVRITSDNDVSVPSARDQAEALLFSLAKEQPAQCARAGREAVLAALLAPKRVVDTLLAHHKPLLTDLVQGKTQPKCVLAGITPQAETQLVFLLTRVPVGTHHRYLEWFEEEHLLSTGLIIDLVRFLCAVFVPSPRLEKANCVPRWVIVSELLGRSSALPSAIQALAFDWVSFRGEETPPSTLAPAIRLMMASLRGPDPAAALTDKAKLVSPAAFADALHATATALASLCEPDTIAQAIKAADASPVAAEVTRAGIAPVNDSATLGLLLAASGAEASPGQAWLQSVLNVAAPSSRKRGRSEPNASEPMAKRVASIPVDQERLRPFLPRIQTALALLDQGAKDATERLHEVVLAVLPQEGVPLAVSPSDVVKLGQLLQPALFNAWTLAPPGQDHALSRILLDSSSDSLRNTAAALVVASTQGLLASTGEQATGSALAALWEEAASHSKAWSALQRVCSMPVHLARLERSAPLADQWGALMPAAPGWQSWLARTLVLASGAVEAQGVCEALFKGESLAGVPSRLQIAAKWITASPAVAEALKAPSSMEHLALVLQCADWDGVARARAHLPRALLLGQSEADAETMASALASTENGPQRVRGHSLLLPPSPSAPCSLCRAFARTLVRLADAEARVSSKMRSKLLASELGSAVLGWILEARGRRLLADEDELAPGVSVASVVLPTA
jgi:hypothetical protein